MRRVGQIAAHLDRIAREFVQAVQAERGELPTAPRESDWSSECIQTVKNTDLVYWRPVQRRSSIDFSGLQNALERQFPRELGDFYSHFWAAAIPVTWQDRPFELLQLWNQTDEDHLMHNFLGHALEKQRAREDLTLFFAVIDDARFLSCDVATGAIMLEELSGNKPEQIADDLTALLAQVSGHAGNAMTDK